MIRHLFSRRPSSSANNSHARLRRAKQARWRQQRRLSLENLEPRCLLTEIPSLSDAQATYQTTMTTLWSQAEAATQTRDAALAAAESQRQASLAPEQANCDADEDLAWAGYLTDVGTANTAYDASVDPAWTTYDSARTTANSDYDDDRTTADGVFQIAEWLANIDYDQDVEDLDGFLEETKAAARTQYPRPRRTFTNSATSCGTISGVDIIQGCTSTGSRSLRWSVAEKPRPYCSVCSSTSVSC